jgi:hypothetical protein
MTQDSALNMKRFASVSFALLIGIVLGAPAQVYGQCSKSNAQNCAYITDGPGGNIYAVDRTDPLGTFTKITSVNGGVTLNDIRVGTDNRLYVTTNTSVLRVNENGSGNAVHVFNATAGVPGPFNGIRFNAFGDAYVNTPNGVYQIGPSGGKHLVEITSGFPLTPTKVSSANCGVSGGLAAGPTGDLYIACDSAVLVCHAGTDGVATCGGNAATQLFTETGAITGLAVDATGGVTVTSGHNVDRFDCSVTPCGALTPITSLSDFPSYIDVAPFPPGFPPTQAGGTPPCNSRAVTIFVSSADSSGKNGRVSRIDTAATTSSVPPNCDTLASPNISSVVISTSKPAVGLGVSSASRTLTKPVSSAPLVAGTFWHGPYTIEITPAAGTLISPNCNLSLTAQRESAAALDAILANAIDSTTGNKLPTRAIAFNGEQGWRTSFHGGYPASGCTSTDSSHIGITASFSLLNLGAVNPWIAIVDEAGNASIDPIPNVYPQVPLPGVNGDPIRITNSGMFTNDSRIVLVDHGFVANSGKGYHFNGFASPLVEPTPDPSFAGLNVINAGKSFTLKFTLDAGGKSLSGKQAASVVTGLSIARLTCDGSAGQSCVQPQTLLFDSTGNSASPPMFNFSSGGFHFNVDTNQANGQEWCNGVYEATANSDSFGPHTLYFTIIGAPAAPNCF